MHSFLKDMPLLVEVARRKSFSKAAEELDIGASTLSRRIRLLEEKMGVLLFYRDTRNVELTPNGLFLLDRCELILSEMQKAYDSVILNMMEPAGLIRVCVFTDTYIQPMKTALCDFATSWPNININMTFVEHPVDMRTDPYDVAFLIDQAVAPPLIARKMLTIEPFLYASPKLFQRFRIPIEPNDLHDIPCIVLERLGYHWVLNKDGYQVKLEIQPAYTFSSVDLCREFALAGLGVTMLRKQLATEDEKMGRLVRVLPEWMAPKHDLKLVTAPGQLPKRIRLFVEHMLGCYSSFQDTM